MKKLAQVMTPTRGPFLRMNYNFEFATTTQLDLLFFTSYSGRTISPIVNYLLGDDSQLSDSELEELSNSILAMYKQKWDKLKAVALLEYDPIHNFRDEMHEEIEGTDDKTVDNTGTLTNTGTQTNAGIIDNTGTQGVAGTKLNTGTQQNAGQLNRTLNDKIFGFNSAASQGENDHITSETSSNTRTDNLTETTNSTRTDNLSEEQSFTRTDNLTRTDALKEETDDDYTRNRDYTRTGNIGNITYQKMLREEIELWQWSFIRQVLDDVKDFCSLSIYS